MEKPKSITQLSKEQLEDMCLNLMHVDKVKTEMINNLELDVDSYKSKYQTANNLYLDVSKKLNQLETNRDEAIRYIKTYMPSFQNYIASDTEFNAKEILSLLERGKE